jgi:hypothetical protein
MSDKKEITSTSFYEYLADGKVMGTRCQDGNKDLYVPPMPMCTSCHSTNMEWEEVSGKGKLRAFSVIGVGTTAMVGFGYSLKNPYCAGIIELEEGPSIIGQIENVDVSDPASIKIGTAMKAKFNTRVVGKDRKGNDITKTFLAFEPA